MDELYEPSQNFTEDEKIISVFLDYIDNPKAFYVHIIGMTITPELLESVYQKRKGTTRCTQNVYSSKLVETFQWILQTDITNIVDMMVVVASMRSSDLNWAEDCARDFGIVPRTSYSEKIIHELTRVCTISDKEVRVAEMTGILRMCYHQCRVLTNKDPLKLYGWWVAPPTWYMEEYGDTSMLLTSDH